MAEYMSRGQSDIGCCLVAYMMSQYVSRVVSHAHSDITICVHGGGILLV